MDNVISDLLAKAEEVDSIVQNYSIEIEELKELLAQGKTEYRELISDYENRLRELHPQLIQIRHAIFKLREAQRLKNEASHVVEEIMIAFSLDKKKRETISSSVSSPMKITKVRF